MKINDTIETIHGFGKIIGYESNRTQRLKVKIYKKKNHKIWDVGIADILFPDNILYYFKNDILQGENQ